MKIEDILIELVNINTEDLKNNIEMIKYLKKKFQKCIEIKELLTCDNKYSLVIGVNVRLKDIEPIVLSAHIDTVASNGNKQACIKDEKIYGIGCCDMKAFVAHLIYNIDYLLKYEMPLVICLTSDEETDLKGINDVLNFFKQKNIKPKFTILGEPTDSDLVVGNKGCLEYDIEVFGKACHSSNPKGGINAIYIVSKITDYIEKLNERYFALGASMNVGKISGGAQTNIVPDYAIISTDLRVTDNEVMNEVMAKLERKINLLEKTYRCKILMNRTLFIPPFVNVKSEMINKFASINSLNMKVENYGTEAGYYQMLGSETVIFGAGDGSLAHKKEENISTDKLEKYQLLFINFMNYLKTLK